MTVEKSKIVIMSIWVLIVNVGLLSVSAMYANISDIMNTYPAKVEILISIAMMIIILSHLFRPDSVMFRIRFVLGCLLLLFANELYYIVKWNSPSIQLLPFIMLLFGLMVDKKKISGR